MASSNSGNTLDVRISDRLSDAFSRFEEKIRAKAYQLSQLRAPDSGDPVADWLEAEAQLLEPVDLEIKEQKKNTVVELKLKSFTPEDIEVEVAGNVLRIFGSHSETNSKKKKNGGSRRPKRGRSSGPYL